MSQSVDTKERILQSAIKIFSEQGYYGTKVSDIVANADLSQGTFYNYFVNKDECFIEILKSLHKQTLEKMYGIINDDIDEEIIFYLSKVFFEKLFIHKLITKIFIFEARSNSTKFQELFYEFKMSLKELFEEAIIKKYGSVENLNIKMMIFTGVIHEIIETNMFFYKESIEDILKTLKKCIDEIFGDIYENLFD